MGFVGCYSFCHFSTENQIKQEKIVLERSVRLNLDLGRGDKGDGVTADGVTDNHLQEAGSTGLSFARGQPIRMIICKRPDPPDINLQEAESLG